MGQPTRPEIFYRKVYESCHPLTFCQNKKTRINTIILCEEIGINYEIHIFCGVHYSSEILVYENVKLFTKIFYENIMFSRSIYDFKK